MDHKKKAKNRSGIYTHTHTNSFPPPMCLSKLPATLKAARWCYNICAMSAHEHPFLGNGQLSAALNDMDDLVSGQQ